MPSIGGGVVIIVEVIDMVAVIIPQPAIGWVACDCVQAVSVRAPAAGHIDCIARAAREVFGPELRRRGIAGP